MVGLSKPGGCDQSTPDINAVVLYCPFISSYIPVATTGTGYTRKHKIPPVQEATSLPDNANPNRALPCHIEPCASPIQNHLR